MADESMIERLTQVVLTEARENGADSPVDYGDAEQIVKAVVRAMRHPTDAMLKAGDVAANDMATPDWSPADIPERTWSTMIDAALNEL